MQLAIYHTTISAVRADTLFASVTQRSETVANSQGCWQQAGEPSGSGRR